MSNTAITLMIRDYDFVSPLVCGDLAVKFRVSKTLKESGLALTSGPRQEIFGLVLL